MNRLRVIKEDTLRYIVESGAHEIGERELLKEIQVDAATLDDVLSQREGSSERRARSA